MTLTSKVQELKQRGLSYSQIIRVLKEEGFSPREINEAVSQSKIKPGSPTDQNNMANQEKQQWNTTGNQPATNQPDTNQNRPEMQRSVMTNTATNQNIMPPVQQAQNYSQQGYPQQPTSPSQTYPEQTENYPQPQGYPQQPAEFPQPQEYLFSSFDIRF